MKNVFFYSLVFFFYFQWGIASDNASNPYLLGPGAFQNLLEKRTEQAVKREPTQWNEEKNFSGYLEKIEGSGSLKIKKRSGKEELLSEGDALEVGDTLELGPNQEAQIVLDEHVQALLSAGSQVRVKEKIPETTKIGVRTSSQAPILVPQLFLKKGEIRALVQVKEKKGTKFFVRTDTATMGVRGTDFIVSHRDQRTQVRTLTGRVELARSFQALRKHRGMILKKGQFLNASAHVRLWKIQKFFPVKFLAKWHQRHPKLVRLYRLAKKRFKKRSLLRKKMLQAKRAFRKKRRRERAELQSGKKLQRVPSSKEKTFRKKIRKELRKEKRKKIREEKKSGNRAPRALRTRKENVKKKKRFLQRTKKTRLMHKKEGNMVPRHPASRSKKLAPRHQMRKPLQRRQNKPRVMPIHRRPQSLSPRHRKPHSVVPRRKFTPRRRKMHPRKSFQPRKKRSLFHR